MLHLPMWLNENFGKNFPPTFLKSISFTVHDDTMYTKVTITYLLISVIWRQKGIWGKRDGWQTLPKAKKSEFRDRQGRCERGIHI
jgi:hypothetical protein